jgi:hypothetical protein
MDCSGSLSVGFTLGKIHMFQPGHGLPEIARFSILKLCEALYLSLGQFISVEEADVRPIPRRNDWLNGPGTLTILAKTISLQAVKFEIIPFSSARGLTESVKSQRIIKIFPAMD